MRHTSGEVRQKAMMSLKDSCVCVRVDGFSYCEVCSLHGDGVTQVIEEAARVAVHHRIHSKKGRKGCSMQ